MHYFDKLRLEHFSQKLCVIISQVDAYLLVLKFASEKLKEHGKADL